MQEGALNAVTIPFIHRINDIDKFNEIYNLLDQTCNKQEETFYTMLEGTCCFNLEGLFNEFALKLKFPDYFGGNWDAFDECLNDLDWLDCHHYILFIKDFDHILADEKNEFGTFIDILKLTVDEWTSGRMNNIVSSATFHIVIHSESENNFLK